jgi:Leucine-rich repeat (LRR) protein
LVTISSLTSLEKLSIFDVRLSSLIDEMSNLTNLQELNISYNSSLDVKQTFTVLGKLPSLSVLSIKNCQLETLPEEIKDLKNLKYLFLQDNLFTVEEQARIQSLLPNTIIQF